MDLDLRELMENFMRNTVSPQTSLPSARAQDLTKTQVIEAITSLNQDQI